jgi:complex iron-sulfur molybdoenzyme family reductase subunit gamma
MRRRRLEQAAVAFLVLASVLMYLGEANPAMAQTQSIGAWKVDSDPGLDGSAPQWQSILPVFVATTAQQVAPPMGGGTLQRMAVRAVHWEDRLYVMLEWFDSTPDLSPDSPEAFSDAAAIQFPAEAASTVPAICMGQADQAVNIWQWRGDQQQDVVALPPEGYVDLYPSTDDLYYTARAAGNPLAQVVRRPVQNLIAGGFGTLTPAASADLEGFGVHSGSRWMVVFSRSLLPQGDMQPEFSGQGQIDVAFAAWDGSKGERDGIKSVSSFTRLTVTNQDPPRRAVAATDDWPAFQPPNPIVGFTLIFVAFLVVIALVILWFMVYRVPVERGSEKSDAENP